MIQIFSILASTLLLLFLPLPPPEKISVKMEVPAEVRAGNEFQVKLSIEKGNLISFSRFVQTLPYGLTAERINTANADFSFDNQRLRIIWLKLPQNPEITVTYRILVDPVLTGSFEMTGEFAFVEDDERKILPVSPGHFVKIIPDPSVAQSKRMDIQDFQALAQKSGVSRKAMEVVRNNPFKSGNFEYTVELRIRNNTLGKFAKIEEYIPSGFKVSEGESKGGIFSFNGKVMKILWSELPKNDDFVISYHLVPDPGQRIEDFKVSGSYSYIIENQAISFAIVNQDKVSAGYAETTSGVSTEEPDSERNDVGKLSERHSIPGYSPGMYIPAEAFPSYIRKPESGVHFRVQVGAGHKVIGMKEHFRKLGLEEDIKMEYHDGWRKYTAGAFTDHEDARAYRDMIMITTAIKDAFIVAYNNGKRITVQEALLMR